MAMTVTWRENAATDLKSENSGKRDIRFDDDEHENDTDERQNERGKPVAVTTTRGERDGNNEPTT
jgi:hypothetical protein